MPVAFNREFLYDYSNALLKRFDIHVKSEDIIDMIDGDTCNSYGKADSKVIGIDSVNLYVFLSFICTKVFWSYIFCNYICNLILWLNIKLWNTSRFQDDFFFILELIKETSHATGIILDPTYTGKTALALVTEMQTNPQRFKGQRLLFIHTG